ncbi:DUF6969 family protein [Ferruginivarius sediminum]|nr:hypothetical protein [Ferruginivarius sediminum]
MRAALEEAAVKPRIDLSGIAPERLEEMAEAGQEVLNVHRVLAKTGDNIVGELLRGQGTFYEWDHYPKGDVYDQETHSQYYYHAHSADQRFEGEHGHFHTFLRPKGMPEGVTPAEVPGYTPPKDPNDALSHIIGISMDKHGLPFRLFTVNRWVTGEVWYSADDVIRMLDHFEIDHARPSWAVNRWISAMAVLFRPQIEELIRKRDVTVGEWQDKHPDRDVYEDRGLEVTSFVDVSIENQVQAVMDALGRA